MDNWVFELSDGDQIECPGVNRIMAEECFAEWYPDRVKDIVNEYRVSEEK